MLRVLRGFLRLLVCVQILNIDVLVAQIALLDHAFTNFDPLNQILGNIEQLFVVYHNVEEEWVRLLCESVVRPKLTCPDKLVVVLNL